MTDPHSHEHCPECNHLLETPQAFCPMCRLPLRIITGRYRILMRLASGGFGDLYQAFDLYERTQCVIKVLKSEFLGDKEVNHRFLREIRIALRLSQSSPHMVKVYDQGQEPGFGHFYAMEFLDGKTLRDVLLDKSSFSLAESLHIFRQLCDAMHVIHQEGVIHRDLKPDNIFLLERKENPFFLKLLDFGIAKSFIQVTSSYRTSGTVGTPGYMSPEQCKAEVVDQRSDVYTMGAILYELISDTQVFEIEGDNPFPVMQAHLFEKVESLASRCPDRRIPLALDSVILKSLAKDPSERYRSVMSFWQDVQKAVPARLFQEKPFPKRVTVNYSEGLELSERRYSTLLITEKQSDLSLFQELINGFENESVKLFLARNKGQAFKYLQELNPDVVLIDEQFKEGKGLDLLREISESDCRAPLVLLLEQSQQKLDLLATRLGASSCLLKYRLTSDLLEHSMRFVIEKAKIVEAVRESEEKFRMIFERSPIGLILLDDQDKLLQSNFAFTDMGGYHRKELLGKSRSDFIELKQDHKEMLSLSFSNDVAAQLDGVYLHRSGRKIPVRVRYAEFFDRSREQFTWLFVEDLSRFNSLSDLVHRTDHADISNEVTSLSISDVKASLVSVRAELRQFFREESEGLSVEGQLHLQSIISQLPLLEPSDDKKTFLVERWDFHQMFNQLRLRVLRESKIGPFRQWLLSSEGQSLLSQKLQEVATFSSLQQGLVAINKWLWNVKPYLVPEELQRKTWSRIQPVLQEVLLQLRESIMLHSREQLEAIKVSRVLPSSSGIFQTERKASTGSLPTILLQSKRELRKKMEHSSVKQASSELLGSSSFSPKMKDLPKFSEPEVEVLSDSVPSIGFHLPSETNHSAMTESVLKKSEQSSGSVTSFEQQTFRVSEALQYFFHLFDHFDFAKRISRKQLQIFVVRYLVHCKNDKDISLAPIRQVMLELGDIESAELEVFCRELVSDQSYVPFKLSDF